MHKDIEKIILSETEIAELCKQLGAQITKDYANSESLTLVGLLKGTVPFIADLMREIDLPLTVEYMDVSSYHGGVESTGEVKILKDLDTPVASRDVLIVEDVIDTGKTLKTIVELLKQRGANSVKVVTLVDKTIKRIVELDVDYIGCKMGGEFIVGYGLDYDELYRNLKYIGVLKEEVYQ